MTITARNVSTAYKQLTDIYLMLHNAGDETRADKVYKLSQDCLYDNYITIKDIKNRLFKIARR